MKNRLIKVLAIVLAFVLILGLAGFSAGGDGLSYGSDDPLTLSDTDYSDMNNWLSTGGGGSHGVDIFIVYPTVTFDENEPEQEFVPMDSEVMRGSAENWLNSQAQAAGVSGNVYAPVYRQLNGMLLDDLDNESFESLTMATPRDDIFAAFDYYLKNFNDGERPFVLFGHSQGAALVKELATLFLGNKEYYGHNDRHIATYAIGYSVTETDTARNPNLSYASAPDDTGVILSWNTTAPSEIASGAYSSFGTWNPDALTINPISWTTEEVLAHAADNGVSRIKQEDGSYKPVEDYANAIVDSEHKVLVVTTVDETDYESALSTVSKFHNGDIPFFYGSIERNVQDRINAFMS